MGAETPGSQEDLNIPKGFINLFELQKRLLEEGKIDELEKVLRDLSSFKLKEYDKWVVHKAFAGQKGNKKIAEEQALAHLTESQKQRYFRQKKHKNGGSLPIVVGTSTKAPIDSESNGASPSPRKISSSVAAAILLVASGIAYGVYHCEPTDNQVNAVSSEEGG